MRLLFFIFSILLFKNIVAQKITGTIFNEKGDLLPFSSITIKGTSIGVSANNRAKFTISLSPGKYTLVCQHIGYASRQEEITINSKDKEISFVLSEQKLLMKEVVIKNSDEDPAYDIIRAAIKKREFYQRQVSAFTCELYTKNMIKLRKLPNKIFGKKLPEDRFRNSMLDTSGQGVIYLSESISSVARQLPEKFKIDVKSSRVSGSGGFGFTFPTFLSFYQNNVTVFAERLNPRGFVSPIADGAIGYYSFKYLGSFWENGKEINTIRVRPRRNYEPLFSGIINISESDWRIHSVDLLLTKKAQLEILDSLQITQLYIPVDNEVWSVKNQLLHFSFNQLGVEAVANFVNVYSDYNLQPSFPKKYFDKVIIKYDTGVNKKTKAYWDSVRPMPLEKEEVKDYQVKDSLFEVRKSASLTKYSIDSLKKRQGKLQPLNLFWKGINRTHYSLSGNYRWGITPLIKKLEYNTAEGIVLNSSGYIDKIIWAQKQRLALRPNLRYGFSNGHLNGWLDFSLQNRNLSSNKKIKRQSWNFSLGKRVTQFNKQSPIIPLINSINTLFSGTNYLKTYENIFSNLGFSKKFESGLQMGINTLYEDRIPLLNSTYFTFFKKDTIHFRPNYPYEKINESDFTRHQAFIVSLDLSIKPGLHFIEYPNRKVPIDSKLPTFGFNYTKGFKGLLGSDVNFDKWNFNIWDDKNLKLVGTFRYKIGIGGFINRKKVMIQDYQHFNGNLSVLAGEYLNSFQLAPYYANSTTTSFFSTVHLEHHFNGLLTNKIPFFNRLNWNLVAGGNSFYINQSDNYSELFVGIENIFKVFRIDFVAAYHDGNRSIAGIRIGTAGLIGDNIKIRGR
ncbi:MAG: carboxypeptidase-like regulatory domain-containing protein [Chitinophagia bacterium]|nr:carboxypeptidase-like regulatory domain-containing protein [Chitinophagia bacterium]